MKPNFKVENKVVRQKIRNELPKIDVGEFFLQHRIKDKSSISKKETKYKQLGIKKEITDYSGVRIIVPRLDDVRKCIELVTNCFEVDYQNSVFNPTSFIGEDIFGYQSAHLIVSTSGLKTEIQIRTQAQHIWAITSHSLNYKSSTEDSVFIRSLNRLSGLLEQVDIIVENLYNIRPQSSHANLITLGSLDHFSLEYYLSRKERLFSIICVGFDTVVNKVKNPIGHSPWSFSMRILDGSEQLVANDKGCLRLILKLCVLLNISSVERLRFFIQNHSKYARLIFEKYKESTLNNKGFVSNGMRLFYFLAAFIPSDQVIEVVREYTHESYLPKLKSFVDDCNKTKIKVTTDS
jgi:ppGpp synthetase/RelA/SpoT-type nucleotidyltranferase